MYNDCGDGRDHPATRVRGCASIRRAARATVAWRGIVRS